MLCTEDERGQRGETEELQIARRELVRLTGLTNNKTTQQSCWNNDNIVGIYYKSDLIV